MPKKDFSGKNKTADTYDKDWVFVKNKQMKGPNDWQGAWMTREQAKEQKDLMMERRALAAAQNAPAGGVPPVPGVPGVPTTAAYGLPNIASTTRSGLPSPGAPNKQPLPIPGTPPVPPTPDTATPSWWIGQAFTNPNEQQQFANIANAILPTLSPEDQRTLGNYLATNFKDVYGGYANVDFAKDTPTEMTDAIRSKFLNPQRAQMALSLLDRMKTASGAANMGGGYDFLKNAVNLINQFSQNGAVTREKYNQFSNAVSGLVQGAGQDMSAYANLAQLFNLPNFSAGPLVSNAPSNRLYS